MDNIWANLNILNQAYKGLVGAARQRGVQEKCGVGIILSHILDRKDEWKSFEKLESNRSSSTREVFA